jgi:hypothetical protein
MSYAAWRALVVAPVVLALGVVVVGCSDSAVSGAVGTAGEAGAEVIEMQVSPPFVMVENRASHPLVNMDLTIRVGSLLYIAKVPRIEANQTEAVQINAFRGPDGAPLNPGMRRPRSIVATASDPEGRKFEVTRPWD